MLKAKISFLRFCCVSVLLTFFLQILVQLTSVNVQRVPETVHSNQQQLSVEEERPPEEEDEGEEGTGGDQVRQSDLSQVDFLQ